MSQFRNLFKLSMFTLIGVIVYSCSDDDDTSGDPMPTTATLTVENVLDSRTLVQSGSFEGDGAGAPVILPGESVSFSFSAARGQAVSFAAMYGWSNDLFFAPENPGITLYDAGGNPVEGDVSGALKLWDNGSRVNQPPGADVQHPGEAESGVIREVNGTDDQGNTYLPAPELVRATLTYDGDSYFTLTLENTSGGTANETPVSPGVWAISYIAGGNILNPAPLFSEGESTYSGLTELAEAGDISAIAADVSAETGIFTPLSPILVVVYNGIENPVFKTGETDRNEGLTELAQTGNAEKLAEALTGTPGIEATYILPDPQNTVLLPSINGAAGGKVSRELLLNEGDHIAIATMYGFSNDWFFALGDNGISADERGDVSSKIRLYDDGTAVNQFPGAGMTQINLGGTVIPEDNPIQEVPNPNSFNTLPSPDQIVKVRLD
ncbi:spondin domain-containing protein [Sinomicrobium kalidii]|uniref:spondin domain-containing protein n=1 Tax=Sinomicrobium kalidii TaxID=2900738 RepID=UPI001E3FE4E5|nr:spondin domain-containing protein [Sinomicrobium kalidii]UGU15308.1 spondin domain-containing protein [Sinomicrobium kalidii]